MSKGVLKRATGPEGEGFQDGTNSGSAGRPDFYRFAEGTMDLVCHYDVDCRMRYANSAWARVTGLPIDEALGRRPTETAAPGDGLIASYEGLLWSVLQSGKAESMELETYHPCGDRKVFDILAFPEPGSSGKKTEGVYVVARDITTLDEYRGRISRLAFYDTLTGLPNRANFNDKIRTLVERASWSGHLLGVMCLDLDKFKEVNDTYGHAAGDEVLRIAAERLNACLRRYDTVARMGGDEFVMLLPEIRARRDLRTVAEKIIAAFKPAFKIEAQEIALSISIGIAVFPLDGDCIDTLLANADSALYRAKREGRQTFAFYGNADMPAPEARPAGTLTCLRSSPEGLILYYRPRVEAATGLVVGAESQFHWNQPDQRADRSLSAKDSKLIAGVGAWALRQTCRAAAEWNRDRQSPLTVSFNLSGVQFSGDDLAKTVRRITGETGCRPEWIELELPERLLLDEREDVRVALGDLHRLGCSLAVDDFSAGYRSLLYLRTYPVDTVKLGREALQALAQDQEAAIVLETVVAILDRRGVAISIDGVDTEDQLPLLSTLHCSYHQGSLYGEPMTKGDFELFLRSPYEEARSGPRL